MPWKYFQELIKDNYQVNFLLIGPVDKKDKLTVLQNLLIRISLEGKYTISAG